MGYYDFPHTRNYDTDLGYLIKRYFELSTDFESLEKNFNDLKAWCLSQLNSEALKTLVANKLDEWLADGTLEALINNPLNHVTTYDTVVEMLTHSGLLEGSKIYCAGADTVNDGKGGHFRIRARLSTDVIDNYDLYLIDGGIKVAERLTDDNITDEDIIVIGDSYGLDTTNTLNPGWRGWTYQFADIYNKGTVYHDATGGAGWINASEGANFLQTLQRVSSTITNKEKIKKVIVLGGYNDVASSTSLENMITAMQEFKEYVNNNYPNASILVGFLGFDYANSDTNYKLNNYALNLYPKACTTVGLEFYSNFVYILRNKIFVYISDGDPNSNFHPNTNGCKEVAAKLLEYIISGSFDVRYIESEGASDSIYVVHNGLLTSTGTPLSTINIKAHTYPFNEWIDVAIPNNILWGMTETPAKKLVSYMDFNNFNHKYLLLRIYQNKIQVKNHASLETLDFSSYSDNSALVVNNFCNNFGTY